MPAAYELLSDVTVTGASESAMLDKSGITAQIKGSTSASTGSVTVDVEVTNDLDYPWIVADTLTLALSTTEASESNAYNTDYTYWRFNVTAISGTGAKVSACFGV